MATLPINPSQMDAILIDITIKIPGLTTSQYADPVDSSDATPNPYYGVRSDWQQMGQPFNHIDEDVIYIRAVEVDDAYNRIRDVSYSGDGTTQTTNYTRVWEVHWTCQGPNSFNNARLIRSSLFKQDSHDLFANSQLYWITDPAAPQRMPEQEDAQWWERTDFVAKFNEFVTEVDTVPTVLVSEIILENSGGVIADINVENLNG